MTGMGAVGVVIAAIGLVGIVASYLWGMAGAKK
jgi:hypothetical protein